MTVATIPGLAEIQKELAERSLADFIRIGWPQIDPADFVTNWHIDAISEHLEAVTFGDLRRLIINIPPRHMKSLSVSVAWPAWVWAQRKRSKLSGPSVGFLSTSYAQSLSVRDGLKCRRLIDSPWYQRNWGDRYALTSDQNTKIRFDNDKGGYRLASSVDGTATGEGGDVIIVDDPISAKDALSDTVRQSTNDWFDNTMSSRLNDPKTGAFVLIMQRLHEDDMVGHVLERDPGQWTQLCLPARYEPDHPHVWPLDPRKVKNELLWPERMGEAEVAQLECTMGPYTAAGQLQQRPSPKEGGVIMRDWLRLWPANRKLPKFEFIVLSLDTAFTQATFDKNSNSSDPTACVVLGVFHIKQETHLMVLDCWDDRLGMPDLIKRVRKELQNRYGDNTDQRLFTPMHGDTSGRPVGRKPDVCLIEDKGSGISLRQMLDSEGIMAHAYNPGRADKLARLHLVSHVFARRRVWLPESGKFPGKPMGFVEPMLAQLCAFTGAGSIKHDDYVDATTQAVRLCLDKGFVKVAAKPIDPDMPVRAPKKPVENPYAV